MSERIWAIVEAGGGFVIRFCEDHPSECGHADECEGRPVFEIPRIPDSRHGERVDVETGAIVFDPGLGMHGLPSALERFTSDARAAAAHRIEKFAPIWRQMNDARRPDDPAAIERAARIDQIREWSNRIEALSTKARSARDMKRLWLLLARTARLD